MPSRLVLTRRGPAEIMPARDGEVELFLDSSDTLKMVDENGVETPVGGGSNDPQGDADAINSQPVVSRRMYAWTEGGGGSAPPIRVMPYGDSLCNFSPGPLMGRAGYIGLGTTNVVGSIVPHTAPSTSNFNYWISGKATTFAVGASAHFTVGGITNGDLIGDRACIGIIKGPGRGSFVLQYASNGAGSTDPASDVGWNTLATINTANATLASEWLEYALPTSNSPSHRLRIKTVTTGDVTVVFPGIFNTNGGGVIWIDGSTDGGLEVPYSMVTPDAVLFPIWRGLRPDLILSCWADGYFEWDAGGAFRQFYDKIAADSSGIALTNVTTTANSPSITFDANTRIVPGMMVRGAGIPNGTLIASVSSSTSASLSRTALATAAGLAMALDNMADWVQISANPGAAAVAAQRTSQRAWAVAANQTYVNGAAMLGGTFAEADARGLMGDDVHLSGAGVAARNQHLWSILPVGNFPLGAWGGANVGFSVHVSSNMDAVPVSFGRPLQLSGTAAGLIIRDRSAPMDGGKVTNIYNSGGETIVRSNGGDILVTGTSSISGLHPMSDNLMLGGRGNLRFRGCFGGISVGWRATTTDTTFATNDHTIEVTSGSPVITLPAATAASASTSFAQNVAAGIQGKIFVLANTGAGTPQIAGTVSGTLNPVVAAQTTWVMQSTGAAWKLLLKTSNAP
jgi:hypothetical protein